MLRYPVGGANVAFSGAKELSIKYIQIFVGFPKLVLCAVINVSMWWLLSILASSSVGRTPRVSMVIVIIYHNISETAAFFIVMWIPSFSVKTFSRYLVAEPHE